MNYKHFSQIERYQIYIILKFNCSITQIADLLGRHKTTIAVSLAATKVDAAIGSMKLVSWHWFAFRALAMHVRLIRRS